MVQVECRSALEEMPHLMRKISLMWGRPELDVFFSRLIMDSRDGARKGLPFEAADEVLLLIEINKRVRAIDLSRRLKLSPREAYQLVDAGDQKRLETDVLDNPLVSVDTVRRRRSRDEPEPPLRMRTVPDSSIGVPARIGDAIASILFSRVGWAVALGVIVALNLPLD